MMERDELEVRNHGRVSNRKKSEELWKIRHIAGKGTYSDGKKILGKWKERTGRRIGEKVYPILQRKYVEREE